MFFKIPFYLVKKPPKTPKLKTQNPKPKPKLKKPKTFGSPKTQKFWASLDIGPSPLKSRQRQRKLLLKIVKKLSNFKNFSPTAQKFFRLSHLNSAILILNFRTRLWRTSVIILNFPNFWFGRRCRVRVWNKLVPGQLVPLQIDEYGKCRPVGLHFPVPSESMNINRNPFVLKSKSNTSIC